MVLFGLSQLHANEMWPWHYLIAGIEGKTTPWLACHNGVPFYDLVGKEPEHNKLNNEAMTSHTSCGLSPCARVRQRGCFFTGCVLWWMLGATLVWHLRPSPMPFPMSSAQFWTLLVVKTVPKDPKVVFVAGNAFDYVPKATQF
ncbi:hypothetical protein AAC387_Pa08g2237 [Persea americana]